MAQHNLIITSIKIWRNNSSFYHGSWIIIIVQVMGTIWAKCDRICCRINASACSSCSLRIICRRWWHIPHEYSLKRTNIYTHLKSEMMKKSSVDMEDVFRRKQEAKSALAKAQTTRDKRSRKPVLDMSLPWARKF